MSALELSSLEFELLDMLEWDVNFDESTLKSYFESLLQSYGMDFIVPALKCDQIEKSCRSVEVISGFASYQPNRHCPTPLQS
jgi:hypothetical protein